MLLIDVLIERTARALNRPFSYIYDGPLTITPGIRVGVNFNMQEVLGYVVKVTPITSEELAAAEATGIEYKPLGTIIDQVPILSPELIQLATRIADYYLTPAISVLQTMLPPSLRPRSSALRAPQIAYEICLETTDAFEGDLTAKQKELLRYISQNPGVKKRDLKSPSVIKKLLELHRISEVKIERHRFKLPEYRDQIPPNLTNDQQQVIDEFRQSTDQVFLLEGVTGSGKTEVYLRIAEEYLLRKQSVLMLVPEIALTPMMVAMFLGRYQKQVAVLHSELTPAEKYDEYRRIAQGNCKIVIGTRSAVFAPLPNLGLIILDEEHSDSYKQDQPPTYHARTVALFRAEQTGAKVLLGSATPSLETKARAAKKVYHQLNLPQRINLKDLPPTTIVNMLDYGNLVPKSIIFSKPLLAALTDTIARKEQAILLINRRGYATYIACRSCGHVFRCPNDQSTLTYHLEDNLLKCHHCEHVEEYPAVCPQCGSKYLSKTGYGTEMVAKEVAKFFPTARLLRLDSDLARERSRIAKTIESFRLGEADILIGTQMIAKGHDFANVTLVGIVNADLGLLVPSYKSSERTFQLITQAVGRGGRGEKNGQAIIQTNLPTHYALTLGAKQDYTGFFNRELMLRSLAQDPPFTFLTKITLKAKEEQVVERAIDQLVQDLRARLSSEVIIVGPALPYLHFARGSHARYVLLKYRQYLPVKAVIEQLVLPLAQKSDIQIIIDVDAEDV